MKYFNRFIYVILVPIVALLWVTLLLLCMVLTVPQYMIYYILKGEVLCDCDTIVDKYTEYSLDFLGDIPFKLKEKGLI